MYLVLQENPSHLSDFSVWQMRGSSDLAQKHVVFNTSKVITNACFFYEELMYLHIYKELQEELESEDNASIMLDSIREDIREKLPVEAVTDTEHVLQPTVGKVVNLSMLDLEYMHIFYTIMYMYVLI